MTKGAEPNFKDGETSKAGKGCTNNNQWFLQMMKKRTLSTPILFSLNNQNINALTHCSSLNYSTACLLLL
jgi:hypothetical protein